jgi:membrane dipeptidase
MKTRTDRNPKNDLFIFDSHCDTANAMAVLNTGFDDPRLQVNREKSGKGRVKGQIFAVWVSPAFAPHRSLHRALHLYQILETRVFQPGYARKTTTISETGRITEKGGLAAWLWLEGGHIIENSLEILELLYSLGFRGMTLTHSENTEWADASGRPPLWNGLNPRGKEIVRKMESMGMAIDVSHTSDQTVRDVLDTVNVPVMASHSNARSLCDIPRNLPDSLIREIADREGFIGVNFYPAFLRKDLYDTMGSYMKEHSTELEKKIEPVHDDPLAVTLAETDFLKEASGAMRRIGLEAVIDHIDHIARVGGAACVGLGSDFDGIPVTPSDLTDASCYPLLAAALRKRGFSKDEIHGITGKNLYHFLKKICP